MATVVVTICISPEVEARLAELQVEFHNRRSARANHLDGAMLMRSMEKLERIAGVLSVWDAPAKPVMTLEHVVWANRLVLASNGAVARFANEFMHGSEVQADAALVLRLLRRCIAGELLPQRPHELSYKDAGEIATSMVLRHSKLESRRFDYAIEHLERVGEVYRRNVHRMVESGRQYMVRLVGLPK